MDNMCISAETYHLQIETEKSVTLKARDYKDPTLTASYWDGSQTVGTLSARNASGAQRMPDKENFNCVIDEQPIMMSDRKGHNGITQDGTSTTLTSQEKERPLIGMSTVRRLTPVECERLQGFPDGWTDIGEWTDSKGKKRETVDSARYKALGNSIALPYWFRLLRRISALYDRPATLGSLFDGISGFPLAWSRCNGSKTCLWSSEIEEFPIAVCKAHFGDEDIGEVGDIEKYI